MGWKLGIQSTAGEILTGAIINETMIRETITIRPMVPLSSVIIGSTELLLAAVVTVDFRKRNAL